MTNYNQTLDLLAEIRATPEPKRASRLAKLAKPVLVQMAALMLREWDEETRMLRAEIDRRQYVIERLEGLLGPRAGNG